LDGTAKGVRLLQYHVEHGREVAGGAVDNPEHIRRRGLLVEGLPEFGGAVFDPLFEFGVGFLQIARHAVEVAGEVFELIAGLDIDLPVELAGADARGASLQFPDRHGHAAGEEQRGQCRQDKGEGEQCAGTQHRAVKRRQGFVQRQFDKDGPAERRDRGMSGQYRLGVDASGDHARLIGRPPPP
jgi:hypothetical protein